MNKIFIALLAISTCIACKQSAQTKSTNLTESDTVASNTLSDENIADAWTYLYGRYLVIQQESIDINKEKVGYNRIKYTPLGSTTFAIPNLDVANLEAWIAVDSSHAVILNVPQVKGRYYTVQLLNGWGEVITNINEHNYPKHPYGKFALTIIGTNPTIPSDAVRIYLPAAKIKMLANVELKNSPAEAVNLQRRFTLTVPEGIQIDPPLAIPIFTHANPIGGEIFDKAEAIIASYPDAMLNASQMQEIVKKVTTYRKSSLKASKHIDSVVLAKAIPVFLSSTKGFDIPNGGWSVSYAAGHFGNNVIARAITNYSDLWANQIKELIYFVGLTDSNNDPLNGSNTYELKFQSTQLPDSMVNAFWSVTLYNLPDYRVMENSLKRYGRSNVSGMKMNTDGSLSIVLAPTMPKNVPEVNWLPTPKGKGFALIFRLYAAKPDVLSGNWFPAPIEKK
ncbi:DUF1214 domain-containing protein [Solitalea sp. MAHUQ-68]|uniref:DUF1214 domain-containing protein n=1 Tax=Solitalea agri TaxID=2953739 RepID=A0A9X2JGS9_9SPHI|nr:DUF1214 domain-containing protein [Solitalea agri]MCO4294731.1 DUF1214 domain-containing protein [Solitalea agri]